MVIIPKKNCRCAGLEEFKECCYTCSEAKSYNTNKNKCDLDNEIHIYTYKCEYYDKISLLKCNECGLLVRHLGNHVKIHGMTSSEYKTKYHFHQDTPLICRSVLLKVKDSLLGSKYTKRKE